MRLTETMINQTNSRTLPVENCSNEMANDVLLQHVARMEQNPDEMEYRASMLTLPT